MTIEEICRWDDRTMKHLYGHYYKALVAYGMQIVGEQEAAEDIVQDFLFALWERRQQFSSMSALRAYIYNGIRNRALNHLRHKNVEERFKEWEEPSESLNREEIYRQLFLAIDELPPRQREIFLMAMEGKKNMEIAQQLAISAETVKVHKRRAMGTLKSRLTPELMVLLATIIN